MSASLCTLKTIYVVAAIYHEEYYSPLRLSTESMFYIEQTAKELHLHNVMSVNYRYPAKDKAELEHIELEGRYELLDELKRILNKWTPIEKLRLLSFYSYQSCEHPEWDFSRAKKIIESSISKVHSQLEGWDKLPWEDVA